MILFEYFVRNVFCFENLHIIWMITSVKINSRDNLFLNHNVGINRRMRLILMEKLIYLL